MKRRFFYNIKTGKYVGAVNYANGCKDGCAETDKCPESAGQVFDTESEIWVNKRQPVQRKGGALGALGVPDSYAIRVGEYSDKQLQAAMMRAKGEKMAILTAEKKKRA